MTAEKFLTGLQFDIHFTTFPWANPGRRFPIIVMQPETLDHDKIPAGGYPGNLDPVVAVHSKYARNNAGPRPVGPVKKDQHRIMVDELPGVTQKFELHLTVGKPPAAGLPTLTIQAAGNHNSQKENQDCFEAKGSKEAHGHRVIGN